MLRELRTIRYMRPRDIQWRITSALKYRLYCRIPVDVLKRWYARSFSVPTFQRSTFNSMFNMLRANVPTQRGTEILQDRFTFLNRSHTFDRGIEWNTPDVPKLWLYNLHYFDYLADLVACGKPGLKKAVQLMEDWIERNPIGRGNGWEPYTLALRIVNWIKFLLGTNGVRGLCDERRMTNDELNTLVVRRSALVNSLYIQTRFLAANLEPSGYSNHTLKSRKALLFAGAFFGNDWFEQGLADFCEEMERQILPDGGHNERSPMYHLLALEDVLDCIALLQSRKHPIPKILDTLLPKMLGFARALLHPDEKPAHFNDSADGIALPPSILFKFATQLGYHETPSKVFPETGYYVLEHSGTESRMIIDCSPLGPYHNPGHAHCDALSYELSVKGRRLIVNSGTYEYQSGIWRDYFRSTRAHNTLSIDGQEQAELWSSFRAATRLHAECTMFDDRLFEGYHDGFIRFPGKCIHRRRIEKISQGWEVTDQVRGAGQHLMESFIHLHPDAEVHLEDSGAVIRLGDVSARIIPSNTEMLALMHGETTPIQGWYSAQFGVKIPNPTLVLRAHGSCPVQLSYRILL